MGDGELRREWLGEGSELRKEVQAKGAGARNCTVMAPTPLGCKRSLEESTRRAKRGPERL